MSSFLAPATTGGRAYLAPAVPTSGGDVTAPAMNGTITVSAITSSGFTLTWSAASDAVGVVAYEFSTDNGGTYTNIGNVLTYSPTGLAPSTLFNIKVRALDAVPNRATPLSTTATTSASSDVTNPTMNGALTITAITTGGFTATWTSGSDNVGVLGYEISIDTGTPSYTQLGSTLTYTATGKAAGTAYTVRVRDYDAAGNRSTPLTTTVNTTAAGALATSVTLTFNDRNGTPRSNLTGMKWAFFDQTTPNNLGMPSAKGVSATTNSAGVTVVNITGTGLAPGAIGWLIFSNSDGTATQSNLISFAGPCVTA